MIEAPINHTLHPTEVSGKFKTRRMVVRVLLVCSFLILPWVKIQGHQALLLDVFHRRFAIFGYLFFAQDVPLLFLLVINFVLGIALTTAFMGRIWCGWMCPQTIFIDGFFRVIEHWVEGNGLTRRKNAALPLNFERALRKTITWGLFAACTFVITHSFLAIFIGREQLLKEVQSPISESPASFLFILIANTILLIDFGWLREQFCMIACPYGKFQSVLQDRFTVSVTYHQQRGEPRRQGGDCVDCNRCVTVCPTGIDIRNGSQLECIACTACMDACNDVMVRLKKKPALIGYYSESQVLGQPQKWIRPRVAIYIALITIFGSVGFYQWMILKPFEVMIYKTKGAPFGVIADAAGTSKITNLFTTELSNKSADPILIELKAPAQSELKLIMPNNPVTVQEGKVFSNPMTIEFDRQRLKLGSADSQIEINVKNLVTGQEWDRVEKIHLIGPF